MNSSFKAIGLSSCAVTIITAISLISSVLVCLPLGKRFRGAFLSFLIALGVGCLVGDAVLHLLPHAILPRTIKTHHDVKKFDSHEDTNVLWRSLTVLLSIYFFYLFDLATHTLQGGHSHSFELESSSGGKKAQTADPADTNPDPDHKPVPVPEPSERQPLKCPLKKCPNLPSIVWMVLVGDAIHLLSDGLAIGAAFSKSSSDGISTSLAVLFHEVPHAIGDFSIIVSAGLTIERTLFLQAFTFLFAYIGLVFGSVLGCSTDITAWVFGITAGMFLFVSLSEMVPEMLKLVRSRQSKQCKRWMLIGLQNAGLLLGFLVMSLLAAFEDKIKHALS